MRRPFDLAVEALDTVDRADLFPVDRRRCIELGCGRPVTIQDLQRRWKLRAQPSIECPGASLDIKKPWCVEKVEGSVVEHYIGFDDKIDAAIDQDFSTLGITCNNLECCSAYLNS